MCVYLPKQSLQDECSVHLLIKRKPRSCAECVIRHYFYILIRKYKRTYEILFSTYNANQLWLKKERAVILTQALFYIEACFFLLFAWPNQFPHLASFRFPYFLKAYPSPFINPAVYQIPPPPLGQKYVRRAAFYGVHTEKEMKFKWANSKRRKKQSWLYTRRYKRISYI